MAIPPRSNAVCDGVRIQKRASAPLVHESYRDHEIIVNTTSGEDEDEYDDDPENIKWTNDYPLIEIYNEESKKWEDEKNEKYENELNLRTCPLCRK